MASDNKKWTYSDKISATIAYNQDGDEREQLLSQIKVLVKVIRESEGKVFFTYLFDVLNASTEDWVEDEKKKRALRIRELAVQHGVKFNLWKELTEEYKCKYENNNKNDWLRYFIEDNKEKAGGYFEKSGSRRWEWKEIAANF